MAEPTPASSTHTNRLRTVRVPAATDAEVRRIAASESESASVVIRRLLRRGLESERRADARQREAGS